MGFRDRCCPFQPQRSIIPLVLPLLLWGLHGDRVAAHLPWSPAPTIADRPWVSAAIPSISSGQFGSPVRCSTQPSGLGFPGFPPGSSRSAVEFMLGVPNNELRGYWGDTLALVYHLIPGKVSLGLLFDRQSQQLQQTEASFALSIGIDVVFDTLDTMLGCRLDDAIREGVRQVWREDQPRYNFASDRLRGVVQWETAERLYIGIWLTHLHDY